MSVNMKQNGSLTKIASLTKAIIPMGLAECYSTEEREVGCWTDGKPLYQKTVYIANVTSGTSYAHGATNVENIFIKSIKAKRNAGWFSSGHIFQDGTGYISESFSIIPSPTVLYAYLFGNTITDCSVTIQYTKTTDTAGGLYLPTGGGTDLKTTLANMGINATFIGEYSEIFNDFCHIVKLSDANVNGQGLYFTNNQTFASTNMTLTIAVTAKKGMIQIGYGTGTLPDMITNGSGRSQFVNIPAGGFGSISVPFGYVGFIGKFFRDATDPVECIFEVNL